MIRRPNVRARCYRLNVQIAHHANYRLGQMVRNAYFRQCRWCRRPKTDHQSVRYPGLCEECRWYLIDLENDHAIYTSRDFGLREGIETPKRILQVPAFQDERPS